VQVLPVLFGIVLVVFLVVRLIPGDPARIMLGIHASETRLAELRAELGLDRPIWEQFALFWATSPGATSAPPCSSAAP
jgi:peptide/nickel transport system permease protein